MLKKLILCAYFLFVLAEDPEIEVYTKLWEENSEKFAKWKNPTYNEEFANFTQDNCEDYGTYDFIIVGAGSAGSVLANRLSANKSFSVLLIEAGDNEDDFTNIPGATLKVMRSEKNWGYKTTPQTGSCGDDKDRVCDYYRGKSFGGTSAINNMIFARGSRQDFDYWNQLGNTGWSYSDVLPYFKKSEEVLNFIGDPWYRGSSGKTGVSYADFDHPFDEILLKSALEKGSNIVDYNGENQNGYGRVQLNIRNGRRESSYQAYVSPIVSKVNLIIRARSLVTKIGFENKTATNITFLHNGNCKYAIVTKELILSAGVINTPQLLQLSSIAPKEDFPDVDLLADLPVGKNFQDHICIKNGVEVKTNHTSVIKTFKENLLDYFNGRGLLTSSVSKGLGFYNNTFEIAYSYTDQYEPIEVTDYYPREVDSGLHLVPILYYPHSKGDVKIKSFDPLDFPLINPNVLTSHLDFEQMYKTLKFIEEIISTESFQKINATLVKVPECEKYYGKKYWYCFIRSKGFPCYHSSGTCRMGKSGDNSVVDNNLMVHGFTNLRVVDASVFPAPVSGHYHATVLMLAEKASDIILTKHLS